MTKDEFIARLKELNLTSKDFSTIANVPYSTIGNWGFKSNDKIISVPKWVSPFLNHYEKSIKYDYIKNEIFDVMKELEKK